MSPMFFLGSENACIDFMLVAPHCLQSTTSCGVQMWWSVQAAYRSLAAYLRFAPRCLQVTISLGSLSLFFFFFEIKTSVCRWQQKNKV